MVAANGDIFVADGYWNQRVVKFNKDGQYLGEVGTPGRAAWQFGLLHHIGLSAGGRLFINDLCGYGTDATPGRFPCPGARTVVLDTDLNWLDEWPSMRATFFRGDQIYSWSQQGVVVRDPNTGDGTRNYSVFPVPAGTQVGQHLSAHQMAMAEDGDIYPADEALDSWGSRGPTPWWAGPGSALHTRSLAALSAVCGHAFLRPFRGPPPGMGRSFSQGPERRTQTPPHQQPRRRSTKRPPARKHEPCVPVCPVAYRLVASLGHGWHTARTLHNRRGLHLEEIMANLTAADIMARSEATLSPDMDIYRAMKQLLKSRLTGAPVVDDDGMLLGMLTERDCLKVLVAGELDGLPGGK